MQCIEWMNALHRWHLLWYSRISHHWSAFRSQITRVHKFSTQAWQHWNRSMCGKKFELCASSYFLVGRLAGWLTWIVNTQCDYRFSRFTGRDPHRVIHKLNWTRCMITYIVQYGPFSIRWLMLTQVKRSTLQWKKKRSTRIPRARHGNSSNCQVN